MTLMAGLDRWRTAFPIACLLALVIVLSLLSFPVQAASPFFNGQMPRPEPQSLVRPSGISMEQAAGMVQRETGGRVLSTTPVQRGGASGYEVRVLVDGKRVKNVFVDARGNIRGQH